MSDNPNTNGDNMKPRIEPLVVIDLVEQYIDKEPHSAGRPRCEKCHTKFRRGE
ncbi:Uncharacterised protein [Mycobacteroides abscessus subsp. abscessus]|nr:Uncharacterised protein [Mycobacteroides abscessus subsp. abscessus]SIG98450.1 Uncharacterised protein [Mycobacteroides abscessus subsp. abscessus]SIL73875.1 Uncharacterised protein [Mycobacteroides abscessus subsp. abscessus]